MSRFIKLSLFATIAIYLLGGVSSCCLAQSDTPGGNATREVSFLLSLPKKATYGDFKAALPAGTRIVESGWNRVFESYCNVVRFSGTVNGMAEFLNDQQRDFEDKDRSQVLASITKLRTTDPVVRVFIFMDNAKPSAGADRARIDSVSETVGNPVSATFEKETSQWSAEWKLRDGRRLAYEDEAEFIGETATKATLYFLY